MNLNEILQHDDNFRYMLLSRMKGDCDYYLGNGNRYAKHLWADNEFEHIAYMKALWNSFDEANKPEWLTYEQLLDYEQKIGIKAILVEMDYKGFYKRFALTPEEFEKEFPNTYKHFGPIKEGNSDTLRPLVHIWFEPCVVGDDAWERHFTDMEDGLPESDIESGNLAYISYDEMQSLNKYLKDTVVYHCRAVFQHDNLPFAETEIKNQCMAARVKDLVADYSIHNFKCVEEGPSDGAADFSDDKFFTFEFDVKAPRDSSVDITTVLKHVDGGELLSTCFERSINKSFLAARLVGFYKDYDHYDYMDKLEIGDTEEDAIQNMAAGLNNSKSVSALLKELVSICEESELSTEQELEITALIDDVKTLLNEVEDTTTTNKPSLNSQILDAAEQVSSINNKKTEKKLAPEQDI